MRIAVEGCCHGELDKIYETVTELEKQNGFKIDLLIICGDFQAVRNFDDLQAMAVPPKFQQLNTFYKYYSREKVAPVLTIFIGGNHEASNYMQELPYGGWVAPNIYYMGYAGIIQVGGLRIGGISGIFKGHDFNRGHHERPPYEEDTKRSVYHIRNLEVFRLKQISRHVDIFISHDWPKGIYYHGDTAGLIRRKPFFKQEIEENKLGSRPLSELLTHLQPSYWFAAHLHVKFAAHVEHKPPVESEPAKCTKFLALDKCLPRRQFLQVLELAHSEKEGLKIKLDPEWLTVVKNTNHLLSLSPGNKFMPGAGCGQRYDFKVTDKEMEKTVEMFGGDLTLPENFVHTSPPITGKPSAQARQRKQPLFVQVNPQTTLLCTMLEITDPNAKFLGKTSQELLDESSIGLPGDDENMEDDSSDDAVYDDEMPSTIDSSMDMSSTSRSVNNSSSWESFQTANETLDTSGSKSPNLSAAVTSTPAKAIHLKVLPSDVKVEDDDDELLSILSAQKSKSANSSFQSSSVGKDDNGNSPSHSSTDLVARTSKKNCETDSTSSDIRDRCEDRADSDKDELDSILSAQKSHQNKSSSQSNTKSSLSHCASSNSSEGARISCDEQDCGDELQAILSAQKSAQNSTATGNNHHDTVTVSKSHTPSSDGCPAPSPLKPERSSFGMSGLSIDPATLAPEVKSDSPSSTSPSLQSKKRDSAESARDAADSLTSTKGLKSTVEGSGAKKLKRRNVSVYSEPVE